MMSSLLLVLFVFLVFLVFLVLFLAIAGLLVLFLAIAGLLVLFLAIASLYRRKTVGGFSLVIITLYIGPSMPSWKMSLSSDKGINGSNECVSFQ